MKRQTALIAAFCAVVCLSLLTPISPGTAAGDVVKDQPNTPISPENLRVRPTYPAIMPDREAAVRLRGVEPECDFEPCGEENVVYRNIGGPASATVFGDDQFGMWDDINMIGTDRFVCRMEFALGDVFDSGGTAVCTLTVTDGNLNPDCPDTLNSANPSVDIVFTTDVVVPMTNPFNLIAISILPSMLIDADFLWIGWSTNDENGDGASWGIAGTPQIGTTADLFLIPNGDGVCTFGAGGDYFWFGGNPVAGLDITVFANPGPPGACCIRDNDIGGGVAECQSEVLRAECLLESITNVWKPLEGPNGCVDFDLEGTECLVCGVLPANACDGATAVVTDLCGDAHNRAIADGGDINQGCLRADSISFSDFTSSTSIQAPFNPASTIVVGQSYAACGTAGNYRGWCQVDTDCESGSVCVIDNPPVTFCQDTDDPGKTDSRDNEWYLFELTEDTQVTISATARFPHEMSLMNNGGVSPAVLCPVAATAFLHFASGDACETITIEECLPPGKWLIRYRPTRFTGVPCNTNYRIELETAACSLTVGACCDTSDTSTGGGVEGCSNLAEIACTGRFGLYQGDGTTCAVEGVANCPGVPANDLCANAIVLSGPSVSVTYDSTFANTTCLSAHPDCPNVPNLCPIGNPPGALPAIVADVYYRYQIPTTFVNPHTSNTEPVTEGTLVLSGKGSLYNSWIVVYGDPNNPSCSTATLCGRNQFTCNQNALLDPAFGIFKINNEAHLTMPVGGSNQFQPGHCILIRVGGTGAPPAGRGPGQLNIDLIPTAPAPFTNEWGRCCFGEPNFDCAIVLGAGVPEDCVSLGGRPRLFTDFHQGDPAGSERRAGCESNPCPGPGDACYTALDFNALVGGGYSGTVTRAINNVLYFKYELPASGGVVLDTCGSAGNPVLAIYTQIQNSPGGGVLHGDCALSSLVTKNSQCTSTFSTATGALTTATCYGGLNATFNACLCLQVGSSPALAPGNIIYIAIGGPGTSGGNPLFGDSPRDVFDPVLTDFAGTLAWQLTITEIDACFDCPAPCPSGPNVHQEGPDIICQDYSGLPPEDVWNGGCSSDPPAFNDVTIDFSLQNEYIICGTAGNFRHAVACTNPIDCPNQAPCDPAGFCTGPRATPTVARDQDWYKVIVDQPSVIKWEVLSAEFAAQLDIFADPAGDCSGTLFLLASEDMDFCATPPEGTPETIEVSASVCAGTYFVRVTPAVFGGLGDTACDAQYVVRATQEPFEVTATCCRGDMNGDGKLNGLDIQKWVNVLFTPPTVVDSFLGCFTANYCRADLNQDGVIDLLDVTSEPDGLVFRLLNFNTCDDVDEGLPVDFVCNDPATSQLPFDSTGATVSDLDTSLDARAADCFQPVEDGEITFVCWWGTYLTTGGSGCPAEPDCFRITILQPEEGCSASSSNRCPSSTPVGTPAQLVLDATRVTAGGLIVPAGVVQQYFYTAELPDPVPVQAGQCYWIEIVNQTPFSDCVWNWSQSPQGDTRHAFKNVDPATGTLPTDYSGCSARSRDLAFSLNLRISKDGCARPQGRCCYDPLPLGDVLCDITSEEDCIFGRNGTWAEGGTCGDPVEPPCVEGRCCFLDDQQVTQCVSTVQSACLSVGGLWAQGASCPCPTAPCCVGQACTQGVSEVACLADGGVWLDGETNCPPNCPTGLCNLGNTHCQRADTGAGGVNIQQGGYVSDADNGVSVADDFQPTFTAGAQFINQVCFRGFHRVGTQDCSPLESPETFRITYYANAGGLPNTASILPRQDGSPAVFNVTPLKKISGEGVAGGSIQYTYEAFHAAVPVTFFQCFWIEIQNTTTDADCVFVWSTAFAVDGNNRAAIRKVGGADEFSYQNIDRDLAFCVGPVQLVAGGCTQPAFPAPDNNQCRQACPTGSPDDCSSGANGDNPNWLDVGAVDWFSGTTFGAFRDSPSGSVGCGESASAPDVFYLWTSGGGQATFELCALDTTFNTVFSLHRTVGIEDPPCPATGTTLLPLAAGAQACDNDSCPVGLGTNVLFFQGRQSRRIVGGPPLPAGRNFIIRISGASVGGQSGNPPKGHFRMRILQ